MPRAKASFPATSVLPVPQNRCPETSAAHQDLVCGRSDPPPFTPSHPLCRPYAAQPPVHGDRPSLHGLRSVHWTLQALGRPPSRSNPTALCSARVPTMLKVLRNTRHRLVRGGPIKHLQCSRVILLHWPGHRSPLLPRATAHSPGAFRAHPSQLRTSLLVPLRTRGRIKRTCPRPITSSVCPCWRAPPTSVTADGPPGDPSFPLDPVRSHWEGLVPAVFPFPSNLGHSRHYTHRLLYTQAVVHTQTVVHTGCCTPTVYCGPQSIVNNTDCCTRTGCCSCRLLHTRRLLHTQAVVHPQSCAHGLLYTHRLFTHRLLYMHRMLYMHRLLFTHRLLYTHRPLYLMLGNPLWMPTPTSSPPPPAAVRAGTCRLRSPVLSSLRQGQLGP